MKKRTKTMTLLVLIVMVLTLLAGCADSGSTGNTEDSADTESTMSAGDTSSEASVHTVESWSEFVSALAMSSDGDTIQLGADLISAGETYGDNIDAISSATYGAATINTSVTIDGQGYAISADTSTVFSFDVTGSEITIKNLTIDGALYGHKMGGAMYIQEGVTMNLENVTFQNCGAGSSTLAGNGGGAIYVNGDATLNASNCTFTNNHVGQSADNVSGRGGAIYAVHGSTTTLTDCTFADNRADYGGAVAVMGVGTKVSIIDCDFAGENDATYGGDDIYIFDGYTYVKKTAYTDSAVEYELSGNTYDEDGETWQDYAVVMARVLGDVIDNTSYVEDSSYLQSLINEAERAEDSGTSGEDSKEANSETHGGNAEGSSEGEGTEKKGGGNFDASVGIVGTCSGNGKSTFPEGWDLIFDVTNYERKEAPATEVYGPSISE